MTDGGEHREARVSRRPTRRHRQNRLIRRIAAGVLLVFCAAGLSLGALRYLSPSVTHSSDTNKDIRRQLAEHERLMKANVTALPPKGSARPVYPYSVVPGGVEDARELKWVAEHDPVVAEHYRGFNYARARVVRLALSQTVYLSYRIGNHVYWTRHRVTLHKGEKLITDGTITARARCANRVEEVPKQLHSTYEPPAAKFDQPVVPRESTSISFPPVEFQSSLLNRPGMNGTEPLPPLSLYSPINGGGGVPVFPPPLPSGVCSPVKKPVKSPVAEVAELAADARKKKKPFPCGTGGGGSTPEPATWLLLITGMVAIGWCVHRRGYLARG